MAKTPLSHHKPSRQELEQAARMVRNVPGVIARKPRPERIPDTPGIQWRERSGCYWVAYWCAPPDAIKLGYLPKTCRLWPPQEALQAKLGLEAKAYLQRECQRLQADCDRWLREHGKGRLGNYSPSLLRLIERYQRDPESTFANLRQSTRETYIRALNILERELALPRPAFPARLPELKALDLKRQYERWAQPDSPGEPRKIEKAHALIGMVKVLLKYAVVHHDCEHAQRILGQLEHTTFSKGGPRRQSVGREQARAIIKAAHAAGYPSIALAQAIAFETGLRPRECWASGCR